MQFFNDRRFLEYSKFKEFYNVLLLCIIGIILRTILFGDIPPGLNQDEAAAGYEAYSLLLTGKDKWGNDWPGYFIAWGAGQNVLYSYLLIPVIHFFGFTLQSVRSINLIFGVLTIPLLYGFTKNTVSPKIAYICTLLLAISPWHIMMSRWGLESNLLPFFILLGFYTVHKALAFGSSFRRIIFCLIPWAIALYSYATFYFILPVLFILIFKTYKDRIIDKKELWVSALLLFSLISSPIILFIIKNSILRSDLFFEKYLPFSIPLLTGTPLRGMNPQTNLEFIFNGFQDNNIWNHIPGIPSFFMISFPFLCVGIFILKENIKLPNGASLFLLWFFSCIPLLFFSSLNINRANSVFIPALVIAVIGFDAFVKKINNASYRDIFIKTIISWALISSFLFATNYFFFYSEKAYDAFNYGLDSAFIEAKSKSKDYEKILVTKQIKLPYVYILFLDQYPPSEFQTNSKYRLDKEGAYDVLKFGRYYFDKNYLGLKPNESFVFIQKTTEEPFCKNPAIFYHKKQWNVGRCFDNSINE
jgi:4-amino-4-deoxy-L-arabinose transferase-like glycosyltransferase